MQKKDIQRTQVWKFFLPILRPFSAICLAAFWLPGDGVQLAPGFPFDLIDLALFLLGKLLIGNEFFHFCNLLTVSMLILARTESFCFKES